MMINPVITQKLEQSLKKIDFDGRKSYFLDWHVIILQEAQLAAKSVARTYTLSHQPYVEIIVSRSMERDARFLLDKEGKAQPANNGFEIPFFDGVSEEAIVTQLLYLIY